MKTKNDEINTKNDEWNQLESFNDSSTFSNNLNDLEKELKQCYISIFSEILKGGKDE